MLQSILYSAPIIRDVLVATLLELANHLRSFGQRLGTVDLVKLARVSLNLDCVHLRASLKIFRAQLM